MPRMAEVTDISKMFTFHNYFRFSPAIGIISSAQQNRPYCALFRSFLCLVI